MLKVNKASISHFLETKKTHIDLQSEIGDASPLANNSNFPAIGIE